MLRISSLKKLVTDSMAIDLGTASTIIAVKGRDVVLDEPSLVAINETTEEIVAFGQEAADMTGREGRDVTVKAPLIGGVVADFERTKKMLAHFVKKAKTGGSNISIQAVMSMVSDVTHVEQRALLNAAEEAHIGKVYMMEEGLAAAFGAGRSKNNIAVLHALNEFCLAPGARTVGLTAKSKKYRQVIAAKFSKSRTKIADDVVQLASVRSIDRQDLVLQIQKVIVGQKDLHDL